MSIITIHRVDGKNLDRIIPGIVNVFRDDEVVPWHRYDECLAWVKRRAERGFYIALACDGDKIVGYSEWIESYANGEKFLYLGIMQVDCDLRGRGIGKIMLEDGEVYAKSISALYLRTIPEDDRAYDFYKKYGFIEVDSIYSCTCPTAPDSETAQDSGPAAVTLEIVNTHEFIFGWCQSSGRHMYEVANHNPEISGYRARTVYIPNGYLQFRYKESSKSVSALYWSNEKVTAETVSAILAQGYAEGFEEINFDFNSKYKNLFAGYNTTLESVEIERKVIL